jgi:plasmid stabilization system protein ParE
MTVLGCAPHALADRERLVEYLARSRPEVAARTAALIISAVAVREQRPLSGRPVEAGLRELVISRGKSGYVASQRCERERDRVLVLALRHRREAGYLG